MPKRRCLSFPWYCCDRKSRAACAQSFAPWQQATIEIMLAISLTIACSRYTYDGVILPAHPARGESHNQRNTTGEVATVPGTEESASNFVFNIKFVFRSRRSIYVLRGIFFICLSLSENGFINAKIWSSLTKSQKRLSNESCNNLIFIVYFLKLPLSAAHSICSTKYGD